MALPPSWFDLMKYVCGASHKGADEQGAFDELVVGVEKVPVNLQIDFRKARQSSGPINHFAGGSSRWVESSDLFSLC